MKSLMVRFLFRNGKMFNLLTQFALQKHLIFVVIKSRVDIGSLESIDIYLNYCYLEFSVKNASIITFSLCFCCCFIKFNFSLKPSFRKFNFSLIPKLFPFYLTIFLFSPLSQNISIENVCYIIYIPF